MTASTEPADSANRLGEENSPYLLQHKDNPVAWMPWGEAALSRAKKENKPILLSIGYAACHWCHVMAHESFEDQATADLMNEHYINIKVDREERPDIDQIYQHALALLGEQGGWPLTMFLTPDAEPFWGGTYFPPDDRYGRPAFQTVLTRLSDIYQGDPDKIRKNVDGLKNALDGLSAATPGDAIPSKLLDQIADHYLHQIDRIHGGLGGAPKFPQPAIFDFMWRAWKRSGKQAAHDATVHTLTKMCQGGIYDHLGGGFARYSTDAEWLAPHFEKMLYDNAQLVELLTMVWQETGNPLYEQRVTETVEWLLREMVVDGGGFAGTLDADSEGEEGKFYVWDIDEIEDILGSEAETFCTAYDVKPGGNWEGKTILNRTHLPELGNAPHEAQLKENRDRLLAVRNKRIWPGLDDKVLADWNGLMIAALAFAGQVFNQPTWITAGQTAFDFVCSKMTIDGTLVHSWRNGRAAHPATLEDYANLSRAALTLFQVTGEQRYIEQAKDWVEIVETKFSDSTGGGTGGYFLASEDVTDLIVRSKNVFDNATPSGNGVMVHVFAMLHYLTGDEHYRERGDALVRAFSGMLERNALAVPVLLSGSEFLENAVQIVVAESREDTEEGKALQDAAWSISLPNRVFRTLSVSEKLPEGHPALGKGPIDGMPTAYVCRGQTCTLPITDPQSLRDELTTRQ